MENTSRLRQYIPQVEVLAKTWYDNPIQNIAVDPIGEFSPTADGACRVRFESWRIGFVKPRPESANLRVVVNEKIASDLGFLLDLPVAAVVVREPDTTWSSRSALSLAALASARPWDVADADRDAELDNRLEALRVFWSWIGDVDHNGNQGNLLYERASQEVRILAIDHSYALGHGGIDAASAPPSAGYGQAQSDVALIRNSIIDRIEQIDMPTVNNIVSRLAGDMFTVHDAQEVVDWLEVRRQNLRRLLTV